MLYVKNLWLALKVVGFIVGLLLVPYLVTEYLTLVIIVMGSALIATMKGDDQNV